MIEYSVVIPTNRTSDAILPLLDSLSRQTFLPRQIIIVYDYKLQSTTHKVAKIYSKVIKKYLSDLHFAGVVDIIDELSTSGFVSGKGASYVRNFGRLKVTSPYMMFVDDDNRLDPDSCEKLFDYWSEKGKNSGTSSKGHNSMSYSRMRGSKNNGKRFLPEYTLSLAEQEGQAMERGKTIHKGQKEEISEQARNSTEDRINDTRRRIIVPLQSHHSSNILIPCLAQSFNYLLCRPRWLSQDFLTGHSGRYCPLSFASSNCLVGPTALFEQFPFDESIPFVYEDMILTGLMSQSGVTVMADREVIIHHYHTHRSKLAQMYIDTPQRAYYKSKHRILLVKRLATPSEKLLFYLVGLWGHTAWLCIHICYYAPFSQQYSLLKAIVRGIYDGLLSS